MVKRIESLKIQNGNDNKRIIYILHILLILSVYKHIHILYNVYIGIDTNLTESFDHTE